MLVAEPRECIPPAGLAAALDTHHGSGYWTAMRSWLEHRVEGVEGRARLVDYLKQRLVAVPVTEIGDLITGGFVMTGSETVGRTADPVATGDLLRIDRSALDRLRLGGRWNPAWEAPLVVAYEDDDLLVVDKPAGLHVHPLGDRREHTLVNALLHRCGARSTVDSTDDAVEQPWGHWRPHVVSRLDCVVSGLLLVAKSPEIKTAFVRAQKRGELHRAYCAMVSGSIAEDSGVVDAAIGREPGRGYRRALLASGGRPAVTRWRVLRRLADRTLVELLPQTGRTHQLRVHLSSIGHPIVGDDLYASDIVPERLSEGRAKPIALRAVELRLCHPRRGVALEFRAELPADFGSAEAVRGGFASR